jgi:hypothetical protein
MKRKALEREKCRRRGNAEWIPQVGERVLARTQHISDAVEGITSKFVPLFEGRHEITRVLEHSAYEVRDAKGKLRGEFNKKQTKDTEVTIVQESH